MTTKFFSNDELACPCCGACAMDPGFMIMIDNARFKSLIPFTVNSAFRCSVHNAKVGGKHTSAHLTGNAMDIKTIGGRDRGVILASLVKAGFVRIGIAHGFIHADNDPQKEPSVWLY